MGYVNYHSDNQFILRWQGEFLDNVPIKHKYYANVVIGDLFEEATKILLKRLNIIAKRVTSGGELHPDLVEYKRRKIWIECKSHGPTTHRFILHKNQVDAYIDFITGYFPEDPDKHSLEPEFWYVLWTHNVRHVGSAFGYRDDLRKALLQNIKHCYILGFQTVRNILSELRLKGGRVWEPFYELTEGRLRKFCDDSKVDMVGMNNFTVYDMPVNKFVLYNSKEKG